MIYCVLCLGGSKVQGEVKNSPTVELIRALSLDLYPVFYCQSVGLASGQGECAQMLVPTWISVWGKHRTGLSQ